MLLIPWNELIRNDIYLPQVGIATKMCKLQLLMYTQGAFQCCSKRHVCTNNACMVSVSSLDIYIYIFISANTWWAYYKNTETHNYNMVTIYNLQHATHTILTPHKHWLIITL